MSWISSWQKLAPHSIYHRQSFVCVCNRIWDRIRWNQVKSGGEEDRTMGHEKHLSLSSQHVGKRASSEFFPTSPHFVICGQKTGRSFEKLELKFQWINTITCFLTICFYCPTISIMRDRLQYLSIVQRFLLWEIVGIVLLNINISGPAKPLLRFFGKHLNWQTGRKLFACI